MKAYIDWFNRINPTESVLGKAAIAHVYFERIHPFEDGKNWKASYRKNPLKRV